MVKRRKVMLRLTVGCLEKCDKDKKPIKMITHLNCAVHYIIDGEGWFNGKKLGKGDGFTTFRNDLVHYYPDKNNPWTYVWFRLDGVDSEDLFFKSGIPTASEAFKLNNTTERIEQVARALFNDGYYEPKNSIEREALAKIMLAINSVEEKTDDKDYAQKAREIIDEKYHTKITVEEVALGANVDRKYLRTLFIKKYGISTMEYMMRKKMERAKELLKDTTASISEVASSVGYDDALGFSRIFKKHVGVSPKDYRENI
jgi:AraC-like DNA-binding protein